MKDNKNLLIGMLCAVLCVMAVAYAAFSTTLNINGTTTIDSTWDVHFETTGEDINKCDVTPASGGEPGSVVGTVSEVKATSATVSMSFTQPGDKAVCKLKVVNKGTLDAKLSNVTGIPSYNEGSDYIKITVDGFTENEVLEKTSGEKVVTITGEFVDKDIEKLEQGDAKKSVTFEISAQYTQNLITD